MTSLIDDTPTHADSLPAADKDLLRHVVLDFRQMNEFADSPWIFVRGEGIRVQDEGGKWYLDGLSGVFVNSLGYGNQRVLDAAIEQMRRMHFAPPLHGTTPPALALGERLRRIAPAAMKGVHGPGIKLLSGGSEATEAAMKLARQYWKQAGHPRKYKIVARYGGYHGGTMGALSATGGWERKSVFEPLIPGFLHHHPPHVLRQMLLEAGTTVDFETAGRMSAELVARTIESEDPETVAAVIVEPVSVSSAGFTAPPPEYYQILRQACDAHNVLLIFDEIITGFGRLGQWFGAEHYGVIPDLLCCGKGMGGGYAPLSAVLIGGHVWEAFLGQPGERKEFHHGHTFGGNPVAAAVGCAAIDEIEARDLVGNAARQGAALRAGIETLRQRFPQMIADVRGAGLLQGFEFDPVRYPKREKPGKRFETLARERGMIARCGDEYVAFAPPLVIEQAQIEEILEITAACLEQMEA